VAVEKLTPGKITKIKSRQDALQAIFSGRLDIFYPSILAVWDEKRVFQHPQAFAPRTRLLVNGDFAKVTIWTAQGYKQIGGK